MDIPQTKRQMADSTVYILMEQQPYEGWSEILAVFATKEAARIAQSIYMDRRVNFKVMYNIYEKEILETVQREGQGTTFAAVGEGSNPEPVPKAGAR